jgi:F0F1-type ATP synthase membrane subunit b/b'
MLTNPSSDLSYTPPYVSKQGGPNSLLIVKGKVYKGPEAMIISDNEEEEKEEVEDDDDLDFEDVHPPTGGSKTPLKRGKPTGSANGRKAIAKRKKTVEEVLEEVQREELKIAQANIELKKARFEAESKRYSEAEKRREKKDELRQKKNDNKTQVKLAKLAMRKAKIELELQKLRARSGAEQQQRDVGGAEGLLDGTQSEGAELPGGAMEGAELEIED